MADSASHGIRTPVRLSLYAAVLLALFAGAYVVAGAVVPDEAVQEWNRTGEVAETHTEDTEHEDRSGH